MARALSSNGQQSVLVICRTKLAHRSPRDKRCWSRAPLFPVSDGAGSFSSRINERTKIRRREVNTQRTSFLFVFHAMQTSLQSMPVGRSLQPSASPRGQLWAYGFNFSTVTNLKSKKKNVRTATALLRNLTLVCYQSNTFEVLSTSLFNVYCCTWWSVNAPGSFTAVECFCLSSLHHIIYLFWYRPEGHPSLKTHSVHTHQRYLTPFEKKYNRELSRATESHGIEHRLKVFVHHDFVGVNSATTAVATPATIATTPKITIKIGKETFRVAHSRSPSAGTYCEEPLVHTARARRRSPWLNFMKSRAGSTYPMICGASTIQSWESDLDRVHFSQRIYHAFARQAGKICEFSGITSNEHTVGWYEKTTRHFAPGAQHTAPPLLSLSLSLLSLFPSLLVVYSCCRPRPSAQSNQNS